MLSILSHRFAGSIIGMQGVSVLSILSHRFNREDQIEAALAARLSILSHRFGALLLIAVRGGRQWGLSILSHRFTRQGWTGASTRCR